MIALIQRVACASVDINGRRVAEIEKGILALIGVERKDQEPSAQRLIDRVIHYRIFADGDGRMNNSLVDQKAALLLVPQFTLAADTRSGTRPGFSTAAPPDKARQYFENAVQHARAQVENVGCGVFGADMQVNLCNDGPVTFWINV